jgi:ABC-type sugar transport system ATPase subunit
VSAEERTPIVEMRGITKSFPGVQALDGVDFTLVPGEIHALAGENGSGKSTLMKILYGGLTADSGSIRVGGEPVSIGSSGRALQLGIVAITQELTLAPTLSVAENVLVGQLPTRAGVIDWRKARSRVRPVLDQLGVRVDARTRVGELSIELQQEIEIARAVSHKSRVLILDEATSSLSEAATERLLERLEQLRGDGVAIVFVSHRLRELYVCASRATVLRDGRLIGVAPLPETGERELIRMMVGREIADLYGKRQLEHQHPVLEVRDLSSHDGTVMDVSLGIRAGEILGVAGLVGSGKSELGLVLAGMLRGDGTVRVLDRTLQLGSPRRSIAAGIGFVPEDRKRSGLFMNRSVRENLTATWMEGLARLGVVNTLRERRLAHATAKRFAVRTRSLEANIAELSGGNQQKVVIARWLALSPAVVVLTEPTRGIDVGAKSEVYRFIQNLAATGAAILMISSELPELLGLADRIAVMYRGRIVGEFEAATATEEQLAHAALGGADDVAA